MKYSLIDSCEWNYPDIHEYGPFRESAVLHALRGGIASFQLHVFDLAGEIEVFSDTDGCEIYEEIPVTVEANPGINDAREHFPERCAPYRVYDCLKPYKKGMITPDDKFSSIGLYIAVNVPLDASGTLHGSVTVCSGAESINVGFEILVHDAPVPDETLDILMGYSRHMAAKFHAPASFEEFERTDEKYLKMLRRQHQNRLYISPPGKIPGTDNEFDFRRFDRFVKKALSIGFKGFHITGLGFRRSWDSGEILIHGMDSSSEGAKKYTADYLTALCRHLSENGWNKDGMFSLGVADEPNEKNCDTYRNLSRFVKSVAPSLSLYDAVSAVPFGDDLDICVPRCDEYEKHKDFFEKQREKGKALWHYVCLYPRENGYINRFLDLPLLATRYLYYGNFIHSLSGYLHWSVNDYQADESPFSLSCPKHINADSVSILPPGDDKLIYPDENGEPLMSMRLENHRDSAEEYEMLRIIAEDDRELAENLCKECVRGFGDVTYDTEKFNSARIRIIENYEKVYKNRKVMTL